MATAEMTQKLRAAYGRGYWDAVERVKKEQESMTSQAKLNAAEESLNSMARKVLDAVPVQEPWSMLLIMEAMRRNGCGNPDHRVVLGCLSRLVDDKLIRAVASDKWQRVAPRPVLRPVAQKVEPDLEVKDSAQPAQPEKRATLEKMADVAAKLRGSAGELLAAAKAVDDLAIEVEERIAEIGAKNSKLAQLQALLRDLA